ncbi:putative uncharacterized protein DDB_G0282133 isoform X2 [Condylostylus longicornis]|uniref:putative uncharacterized protein DDB_G0282133 isoform X2 n=1 Tax=Condylostylus longicornis TaxID=2530218 RepID=UPI00244DA762|nr:putative uncharacterized protein DDB_G0282133 isoform X2 [Condylostylus longicornis]
MNNSLITELTNRLISALDSNYDVVDMDAVLLVISMLEGAKITKEQLETTRLAMYINTLRRRTKSEHIARRSKNLLKKWREMFIPTLPTPQQQQQQQHHHQQLQQQQYQHYQKQQQHQQVRQLHQQQHLPQPTKLQTQNRLKSKLNNLPPPSQQNIGSPPTIILDDCAESNDYVVLNSDVIVPLPQIESRRQPDVITKKTKSEDNSSRGGFSGMDVVGSTGGAIPAENSSNSIDFKLSTKNALSANSNNLARKADPHENYGDNNSGGHRPGGESFGNAIINNISGIRNRANFISDGSNSTKLSTAKRSEVICNKKQIVQNENSSTMGVVNTFNNKQVSFANVLDTVSENLNLKMSALPAQQSKSTVNFTDHSSNQNLESNQKQSLPIFNGQMNQQPITIDLNDSNDDSNSNLMDTFDSDNTIRSEGGVSNANNPMTKIIQHRKNRKHKKDKKRYKEKHREIKQQINQPTINLINDMNDDCIFPNNTGLSPSCSEISSKTINAFDVEEGESRCNVANNVLGLPIPNEGLSLSNSSLSTFPSSNANTTRQTSESTIGNNLTVKKTDLTFAGKFKKSSTTSTLTNIFEANTELPSTNNQAQQLQQPQPKPPQQHQQQQLQQKQNQMLNKKLSKISSNDMYVDGSGANEPKIAAAMNSSSNIMIVESRSCSPFEPNILSNKITSSDVIGTNSNDSCNSSMSNSQVSSMQNDMLVDVENNPDSQGKALSSENTKTPKKRGRKKGSKGVDAVLAAQISNTNFMNSQLFESSSKLLSVVSLTAGNKKVKTTKELLADIQNRKIGSSATSSPTLLNQSQSADRSLPPSRPVSRPPSRPLSRAASRPTSRAPSVCSDRSHSPSTSDACTLITTATSTPDQFGNVLQVDYSSDSNLTLPGNSNLTSQSVKQSSTNAENTSMNVHQNSDIADCHKTVIEDEIRSLKAQLEPLQYDDIQKRFQELIETEIPCTCTLREVDMQPTNIEKSDSAENLSTVGVLEISVRDSERENDSSNSHSKNTVHHNKNVFSKMQKENKTQSVTKIENQPKPKKSIFDLDYEEHNDPLNSIMFQAADVSAINSVPINNEPDNRVELMSSDSNDSNSKDSQTNKKKLGELQVEKKIFDELSQVPMQQDTIHNSDFLFGMKAEHDQAEFFFPTTQFKIIEDPNCLAKQYYEIQTQQMTKFRINALHNCYISDVNGDCSTEDDNEDVCNHADDDDISEIEELQSFNPAEIVYDSVKLLFPDYVDIENYNNEKKVSNDEDFIYENVVPLYSDLVHDIIPKSLCNIMYDENILRKFKKKNKIKLRNETNNQNNETLSLNDKSKNLIKSNGGICKRCNIRKSSLLGNYQRGKQYTKNGIKNNENMNKMLQNTIAEELNINNIEMNSGNEEDEYNHTLIENDNNDSNGNKINDNLHLEQNKATTKSVCNNTNENLLYSHCDLSTLKTTVTNTSIDDDGAEINFNLSNNNLSKISNTDISIDNIDEDDSSNINSANNLKSEFNLQKKDNICTKNNDFKNITLKSNNESNDINENNVQDHNSNSSEIKTTISSTNNENESFQKSYNLICNLNVDNRLNSIQCIKDFSTPTIDEMQEVTISTSATTTTSAAATISNNDHNNININILNNNDDSNNYENINFNNNSNYDSVNLNNSNYVNNENNNIFDNSNVNNNNEDNNDSHNISNDSNIILRNNNIYTNTDNINSYNININIDNNSNNRNDNSNGSINENNSCHNDDNIDVDSESNINSNNNDNSSNNNDYDNNDNNNNNNIVFNYDDVHKK